MSKKLKARTITHVDTMFETDTIQLLHDRLDTESAKRIQRVYREYKNNQEFYAFLEKELYNRIEEYSATLIQQKCLKHLRRTKSCDNMGRMCRTKTNSKSTPELQVISKMSTLSF